MRLDIRLEINSFDVSAVSQEGEWSQLRKSLEGYSKTEAWISRVRLHLSATQIILQPPLQFNAMEEHTPPSPHPGPIHASSYSPKLTDTLITSHTTEKHPKSLVWGNIRHVIPYLQSRALGAADRHRLSISTHETAEELDESSEQFEVVSPVASTKSGGSFKKARDDGKEDEIMANGEASRPELRFGMEQEGLHEDEAMRVGAEASQSTYVNDDETDVGLGGKELDVGEAREVAARALAVMPEENTSQALTIPLHQVSQRSVPLPAPAKSSPSSKPLRSPCWRSLVPVTPPPGGFWTPSSKVEGEKNSPMCGPCRTGKKGRCFGGLPCDRCKEKGYSKERCEGSVVFRFSPESKRGKREKEEKIVKKSPEDSGGWKRDAFGRFA